MLLRSSTVKGVNVRNSCITLFPFSRIEDVRPTWTTEILVRMARCESNLNNPHGVKLMEHAYVYQHVPWSLYNGARCVMWAVYKYIYIPLKYLMFDSQVGEGLVDVDGWSFAPSSKGQLPWHHPAGSRPWTNPFEESLGCQLGSSEGWVEPFWTHGKRSRALI